MKLNLKTSSVTKEKFYPPSVIAWNYFQGMLFVN